MSTCRSLCLSPFLTLYKLEKVNNLCILNLQESEMRGVCACRSRPEVHLYDVVLFVIAVLPLFELHSSA